MSAFTKTLIVDCDGSGYTSIRPALEALNSSGGGTIIVEQGEYEIYDSDDNLTVPSNTTLIGPGC
jgi:hypothetical protein